LGDAETVDSPFQWNPHNQLSISQGILETGLVQEHVHETKSGPNLGPQIQQFVFKPAPKHVRPLQQIHHLPLPDKILKKKRDKASRSPSPHTNRQTSRSRSRSASSASSTAGSISSDDFSDVFSAASLSSFGDGSSSSNSNFGFGGSAYYDEDADVSGGGVELPSTLPRSFKLPTSKSPIIEALACCAANGWGIEVVTNLAATDDTPAQVIFRVTDFQQYYAASRSICSKQNPTDNMASRVKALRRWFVRFPKKSERKSGNPFILEVKPDGAKKVQEIVEKHVRQAQQQAPAEQLL